jgi:hypothetical protein
VNVYPIPSNGSTYVLRLEGWREPISFVTTNEAYVSGTVPGGYYSATAGSSIPDMPQPFHEAILNYAIGLTYAFLDEGDRSMFYVALCDNAIVQQEDIWFRSSPSDGPLVVGKGKTTSPGRMLGRLRYDWE